MTTFREWLDEFTAATGERVTHLCLGRDRRWPLHPHDVARPIDEFADVLDFEFNSDFGSTGSPNLCGWSPSWVIFSDEYDGSETLQWVPRFPTDHQPIRPGGG